ncbi:DUF3137 domain-containing protein [Waterburya agarophytonicola K14]|uniref:DUF3137 domain-containing protein n=1 Tax=Waterburya agarophytonicola KI4 TaxID=2874699 RepID=A0A964BRE8_9CYAN|nr:DUF3137 domain-containing protein [Waterburya agarophytonicola KI4]
MDKSLSSQEIDRLFIAGDRNLYQGNFPAAIDIFEQLSKILEPNHEKYFHVRRNLIKAYQKNQQIEKAIALCQLAIDSENNTFSFWGTKFMAHLDPQFKPEVAIEAKDLEVNQLKIDTPNTPIKFKTLSQFKQYCQEHLLDKLKELEKKRIQTLATIFISGIICLIATWGFAQFIFGFLRLNNNIFIFYLICLSFAIPVWLIFCRGCIQVYGLGFKRNIIEKIIDFIDEPGTLSYANQLFLEDKRQTILGFTRSQIFRDELQEPDNLEQEDCVYGTIGNTDIFFAEIMVENIKEGYLNEFEMSEFRGKSIFFRGLFFEAEFSKKFLSRTFILPNTFKNKVSVLNNWRGQNVDLEDPEFKQMFKVYGDNQVESRYILSTNLMNRLVEFRKKAKRQVYLSFVDGFLYIAIPYRHNLFEPKLFQKMTSFTPLREYFFDLQLMIGIVDDLNLNRRIWGRH